MKAQLYVQGNFWATVIIPGNNLLTLLAQGMIAEANRQAAQLAIDLGNLDHVECSINLRFREPVAYIPKPEAQP